jgi:signal transduction histidine kinase
MNEDYAVDRVILQQVLAISQRMAVTRELNPLLDYVMEQAVAFTGGEHGYLVLVGETGNLDFRVKHGEPDKNDKELVSNSIIEQVVRERQPVLTQNALQDGRYSDKTSVVRLQLRSVLCVPLMVQGKLLGVLYIENRKMSNAFGQNDIPPLMIFAAQAAVAIENARLNEEQEHWANELEARVHQRTAELEASRIEAESGWNAALEANRIRTQLLSNITHDLRSPLNTIINILDLFRVGEFGELAGEQVEWIQRALEATQQINRLVTDIFDLSKLEQGKLRLYSEPIPVEPIMQQALAVAEVMKSRPQVHINLTMESYLPLVVADYNRVQQVLVNLLSNAIKHTEEGRITLQARLAADKRFVQLSVSDTGGGIMADDLDQVFERFRQADPDEARRRIGTGLGLAICKELVEQHGGQIWAESVYGEGSTFHFTLPVATES